MVATTQKPMIRVVVKSPTSGPVNGTFPSDMSLAEVLAHLPPAKNETEARALPAIERQLKGRHTVLWRDADGRYVPLADPKRSLGDLAVPVQLETPAGPQQVQMVSIEVHGYAALGG